MTIELCKNKTQLLVRTYDVEKNHIKHLVRSEITQKWKGAESHVGSNNLEKIRFKDSKGRAVRITCLDPKFNTERAFKIKFINTDTGETSESIELKETKMEVKQGEPDLIKLK